MSRILLILLFVFFLLPTQVGGSMTYLILTGNSMEPGFRRGDMVLVREADTYAVGDVAAYQHPTVGAVIHRIIRIEDGLYVFQGDNNTWVDSHRPSKEEIIGGLFIRIPTVGKAVIQLRGPTNLALFSVGSALMLVAGVVNPRKSPPTTRRRQSTRPVGVPIRLQDIFLILGLLTLMAAIFGANTFTRPTLVLQALNIPYEHNGRFGYSAEVPIELFYTGELQAGDPIFRRVTDRFTLHFEYQLDADQLEDVIGSYRVLALVSESSGWNRMVVLQEETPFSGKTLNIETSVRLSRFQEHVDMLAEQTGISPNSYTLSLRPEITVGGQFKGEAWTDNFSPRLNFLVRPLIANLFLEDQDLEDILEVSQEGTLFDAATSENEINLLGITINIFNARLAVILVLAFLALAVIATGLRIFWLNRQKEADRIEGLYGGLIISVSGLEPAASQPLVEVENMESIIRLAQQEGRSILRQEDQHGQHYYVQGEKSTYHYGTNA